MIDTNKDVLSSPKRICPDNRKTPLDFSFYLSTTVNRHGLPKLENLQYTGSFKVYNAIRNLPTLDSLKRNAGIMAESIGNKGCTAAYGLGMPGINGTIFLPDNTLPLKVNLMELKDNP
jgi:threonine dehydratase